MNRPILAIIGAGQIGRRHLQALKRLNRSARLFVVDPNPSSLTLAKKQYKETPKTHVKHDIYYLNDLGDLPDNIDVAIIATTSDVRKTIVLHLLETSHVDCMILEKVVFQDEESFVEINDRLQSEGVMCWVNCPLRTLETFEKAKEELRTSTPVHYRLVGSDWNLASNAIHHLDLFSYLTDERVVDLSQSRLNNAIQLSKRKGFYEVTGTLEGLGENGSTFKVTSQDKSGNPFILHVSNSDVHLVLNFTQQEGWVAHKKTNWLWKPFPCDIVLQSNLTHLYVEDILNFNRCKLPTYQESWQQHLPLLKVLSAKFKKAGLTSGKECPIS
ncbi:Gfo/Idh/MocA family oxidoreductase [Alteribacter aurantiacus]|uniref:Gfo/Idh/MocA family oxidoreductase n=1 Tax=Alteribacter aurantiacus TaxID=254410 RepID=UPI000404214B|nr:Gfo/Idh/MocA family oxidoreductase [Alteribacter aurantiacus]